jgi:hypothetical protein
MAPSLRRQHGCDAGNLIPNCNFDAFSAHALGQVPVGWTPFVQSGSLAYQPHVDTYWGAPSLAMWSDGGTFRAGIYTQVGGVTPGATYRASMGWGAPTEPDAFGRALGIDPTGGTDPAAPTVIWGPMHRGRGALMNDKPGYPNIDVRAAAASPTVTVFVLVDHPYSTGANQIFIDAVGLYRDESAPVQAPSETPAPAPVAAPAVPRAAPSRAPTRTASPAPTATTSHTPTASPMPAPTLAATPSVTPSATATSTLSPTQAPSVTSTLPPRPRATMQGTEGAQMSGAGRSSRRSGLLVSGLGAIGAAGLLGLLLVVTRRQGR